MRDSIHEGFDRQGPCWCDLATITKCRRITAAWKVDDDQITCAGALIISLDRTSQPPRCNPDDRVSLGIEVLLPSESRDGNRIAFKKSAFAAQHSFDGISKECGQLGGGPEHLASQHGLQRRADLGCGWVAASPSRRRLSRR